MSQNNESKSLKFLYNTFLGRCILKVLTLRFISKFCGFFLDRKISKCLIKGFIKNNNINVDDYYLDNINSFNDFFTRKIKESLRTIDMGSDSFISPCDGFLSAYHINEGLVLPVKHSHYTIESLLQDKELVEKYNDGICLVFRLGVNNYHRYAYLDSGFKKENVFIKGKLHTVRPIALDVYPVFAQNAREYTILNTDNFGDVIQIEVGALLVGKIKNYHQSYTYKKGEEKGLFLYGGSTIIVLLEKDKVVIDNKYFDNTSKGIETEVFLGQKIGIKRDDNGEEEK